MGDARLEHASADADTSGKIRVRRKERELSVMWEERSARTVAGRRGGEYLLL